MLNDTYFTDDLVAHMVRIGNEEDSVYNFLKTIENRTSKETFNTILKNWNYQDEKKQIQLAKEHAGAFHLSRFLIMMDYLYAKHVLLEKLIICDIGEVTSKSGEKIGKAIKEVSVKMGTAPDEETAKENLEEMKEDMRAKGVNI